MNCRALCFLAALLACGVASLAHAQEAEAGEAVSEDVAKARAHFQKGVDYYTEGDLAAAMVELKRAYELEPSYRLLYNLAQVSYEQRDYAQAERYFRDYLARGKAGIEPTRREEVQAELQRLKGRVADVRLRSNRAGAQLFIDERPVGRSPLAKPVRVSAGHRTVRAELHGFLPVQRKIDVVGGEPLSVELDFAAPADIDYSAQADGSGGTSPALWTGIATGVLGLGTVGMAVWTASDESKYEDALAGETSRRKLDDLADSTERKALITDVLLGATVVTGVITVILLLTDGPEERATSSSMEVGVGVGVGSVRARF